MTGRGKILVALALLLGGWLCFDGLRALLTGSYTTPGSGPHAGQLGPWATLIVGLGLDPSSFAIKCLHLGLGAAWLFTAVMEVIRRSSRRWWVGCAVASLWYAPFGTIIGLTVLVLVLVFQRRGTAVAKAAE